MSAFSVRELRPEDVSAVVELQALCFGEPFDPELLWSAEHLNLHLSIFPEGQFVATAEGKIIGSASSSLIADSHWQAHLSWEETLGGHYFETFDSRGSTLYGADISVHPEYRGIGVARMLYGARFALVRSRKLVRFGTACRMPGYRDWSAANGFACADSYLSEVVQGFAVDRTLTPLLKLGLEPLGVIEEYMEDAESGNAAALLEWTP